MINEPNEPNEDYIVYYNKTTKKIKNNLRFMEKNHSELFKEVDNYLKNEITESKNIKNILTIKFYCYVHQTQLSKCKHHNCQNEVVYQKGRFNEYCSIACCNTSDLKQQNIKRTWDNKTPEEHQIKIDKFKKTYQKNFDSFKDNIMTSKKITNLEYWNNKKYIEDNFFNQDKTFKLYDFMDFFNCCQPKAHNKLKELNIQYNKTNKMYSQAEKEVVKFIQTLDLSDYTIVENSRIDGLEFDILIKKDNVIILGIEYNGLYWHSYTKEKNRPKSYYMDKHILKTQIADNNNFMLFHIFENEWQLEKTQKIWKSQIKNILGLSNKIYARKCHIKIVSSQDATEFLEQNHQQGKNNKGSIRIGLYYKNELIQLGTFGKPQFKGSAGSAGSEYELIRLCAKINYSIIGGASKIIKHFERKYNPDVLISYANRRWSRGNVYTKLDFKLESISRPNHYYIKSNKLVHRMKYQTHKVKEMLLDKYNTDLSGQENAIQYLNLGIIWDSGNYVFIKKF